MISFDSFRMEEGTPIYTQIILYLKRGMVGGTICAGDELPSRRQLSARLGVNPNTIQKAYRLLEEENLIVSQAGAKSSVVLSEETLRALRRELLETDVRPLVGAMARMGLTKQEAMGLLERFWPEEEAK